MSYFFHFLVAATSEQTFQNISSISVPTTNQITKTSEIQNRRLSILKEKCQNTNLHKIQAQQAYRGQIRLDLMQLANDGVHDTENKIQPLVCASPKTGSTSWVKFLLKYSVNDTIYNNKSLKFETGWKRQVQSLKTLVQEKSLSFKQAHGLLTATGWFCKNVRKIAQNFPFLTQKRGFCPGYEIL